MKSDELNKNRLDLATSPYLLQHKDNPVHWQSWGDAAFSAAVAENKPILLSIGYAACHWCHVMAHESFEDPEVADLMNQHFISIKVDREERPDVDAIYQNSLAVLGEQGGWPLTMFLTPKGEPFWGGTYFPPRPSYGRPDFKSVLNRMHEVYADEPDTVLKNQTTILRALADMQTLRDPVEITPAVLNQISERLLAGADPEYGGIGQAQKFPQTGIYKGFWRAWQRTGRAEFRNAVILMVQHMCAGGIYDHLGGGFARYTVERSWLVPHFEKMLYDQSQIVSLLIEVWRQNRDPVLLRRVEETFAWLDRDMLISAGPLDQGAYAASLDADSEGVEGAYYVWNEGGVDSILAGNPDREAFKVAYDVTAAGNWEGKSILHLDPGRSISEVERFETARSLLLAERQGRIPPDQDDKILCDWNAMLVTALAEAGMAADRQDWVERAAAIFAFLRRNLDRDERLYHSFRKGVPGATGLLEDYASMAEAALTLHEATGDPSYLERAQAWVAAVGDRFLDEKTGGYYQTADDGGTLLLRPISVSDNAVPSGNGTMLSVLARLFHLTGDPACQTSALRLIDAFSGEVARNIYPLATFLEGVELFHDPLQIVIVGDRNGMAECNLLRLIWSASLKGRVLSVVEPGRPLPSTHPAAGKTAVAQSPTVYLCKGAVCSLPVIDEEALRSHLSELEKPVATA